MGKDLLSDFENATEQQWIDKINTDLKGKPFDSLLWNSEIGNINPVLFEENTITVDNFKQKKTNEWYCRQYFDANVAICNQQIIKALKGGVNAIEIKNISSRNIEATLQNVMLGIIAIHIDINTSAPLDIIKTFSGYCYANDIDTKILKGGFKYDPIGNFALTGTWFNDKISDIAQISGILTATEEFKGFSILNINAQLYGEAGANIDTQIAISIAHGNEYLNAFKDDSSLLEQLINKTEFIFSIGTSYFLEIAKLRAFRSLWSIMVNEYVSLNEIDTKIHAINANLYYSNKDIYTNLLRATTGGMSAVIGGCDSLTLLPFNQNTKEDKKFALRLSKNIQLILQEESYFKQVKDTSKGAYYIENLISTLKEKAWDLFLKLEEKGGVIASLQSNLIQEIIEKEFEDKENALKQEDKIMIGVNKFINKTDKVFNSNDLNHNSSAAIITPINPKRLAFNYE